MPTKLAETIRAALTTNTSTAQSDRTDLCVKVMDKSGVVKSINAAGLKLLGLRDRGEICDRSWFQMWNDGDRVSLEMAVAKATMGSPTTLHMSRDGDWLIDIMPLSGAPGNVQTILVVSRLLDEKAAPDSAPSASPVETPFEELNRNIEALSMRARTGLGPEREEKVAAFLAQASALTRAMVDEIDSDQMEPDQIDTSHIG